MGCQGSKPIYSPPPLPVLPKDQQLDEQGTNYLEWRARMRTIFEAYGLWEEIEETPRVCGDGAAFAKAILLANMHSPFMQSRVISGSDALTCTRFNKWEVEDENVAFIWRRLQGTMKDDRIEVTL